MRRTNNREVCHLWANRSCAAAHGSNLFFNGDTVYSYGRHFPIARLIKHPDTGADCVLYTSREYSRTTGKHKSFVRSACCHLPVYVVTNPLAAVATAADLARLEAEDTARRAKLEAEKRERRKSDARRQREQARRNKEIAEAYPSELTAWREGGPLPRLCNAWGNNLPRISVALRLIEGGRYIETTKCAKVPTIVARKAWPVLKAAVDAEDANPAQSAWVPFFNLPDFNWGNYRGISLRRVASGSPVELVVGCHQIPWAEVVLIAERLGLVRQAQEVAS